MLQLGEHEMATRDFVAEPRVFVLALEVLGIHNVRPEGVKRRAPRDGLVEAERRPAVGSCDHKHVISGIDCLVARSQRRPHARDGRLAVDYPDASARRKCAPLREGLILDTDGSCTSLSEAADRPAEVRGAAYDAAKATEAALGDAAAAAEALDAALERAAIADVFEAADVGEAVALLRRAAAAAEAAREREAAAAAQASSMNVGVQLPALAGASKAAEEKKAAELGKVKAEETARGTDALQKAAEEFASWDLSSKDGHVRKKSVTVGGVLLTVSLRGVVKAA